MKKLKFRKRKKYILHIKRMARALIPAVAALLFYKLLPHFPAFTDAVFSSVIFRIIAVPLGFFLSILPLSLTEILAILALPALVLLLIFFIRRLIRSKNRLKTAGDAGVVAVWVVSAALLFYMLLHGVNFYRLPASELMELDTSQKSAELLQSLWIDLAKKASAERQSLKEDENGCTVLSKSLYKTLAQAGDGYKALDDRYPFLWGVVSRAKPVQLSHWWSYTGISGMYFPFLLEANVNIDQPDFSIPSTAAHELAHTRGFAREDECNFFAVLSCLENPSADYRYSGALMAYIYCSNALYAHDADLWAAASAHCSDGIRRDLNRQGEYWKQFEGKVQKAAEKINDGFIQSQGVDDGVLSYDRVVELLLAYYEKEGLPN
ncbi:MAG TPA: hypothetical protein DEP23_15000 [Ruminococcaceae bacterium]|nr:hypothetical protein [Oscillospiraceae bacterium]